MDAPLGRRDELHHLPEAAGAGWYETFALDFAEADGSVAGYLVVTLRPGDDRSWCWAAVAGRGRPLVAVVEDDAPLPRRSALELRAPGLWVDVQCEEAFDRVSVGLEAFGVEFDDVRDAVGHRRGVRVPVGFDLEWERVGPREATAATGYALACRVVGEVLVGDERLSVDGSGRRSHCWGTGPWWEAPTAAPEAGPADVLVAVPGSSPAAVVHSSLAGEAPTAWRHRVVRAEGVR